MAAPSAHAATYRYAASSNRIYVGGIGTVTLGRIKAQLPAAPLTRVGPIGQRVWLLGANLQLERGVKLRLHGSSVGGDVNELRLKSDNVANGFVSITADYGSIDIKATRIKSWDSAANGPDTQTANGRAFIRVRSRLGLNGVTPLESRMDIVDSEISYLGYEASESYGLVWKVLGTGEGLYDRVQVRGDVIGSHIHHNYYGIYTYGHEAGLFRDNEIDHNIGYGLDPHDDSDRLVIEDNNVHDNGNHGIIASMRCDHLVIRGNQSWGNVGAGIMVHRSSDDALIEDNQVHDNTDAGIAVFGSSRTVVRNNVVIDNLGAGLRFSVGGADNVVETNHVEGSGTYGLHFFRGTDTPEPGDDGRPKRLVFTGNRILNSTFEALKMSDSDAVALRGNDFGDDALAISSSTGIEVTGNAIPGIMTVSGNPALGSTVTFSTQTPLKLVLDTNSFASFVDSGHIIFDTHPGDLATTAHPGYTAMILNGRDIGGQSTISTLPFHVTPTNGASLQVTPLLWNKGDVAEGKQWTVLSNQPNWSARFVVGDMTPRGLYLVRAGETPTVALANAAGQISFNSSNRGQGPHSFQVVPLLR